MVRFGPYELDARAGELRKFGIRIKLREQPVRILTLLLEKLGEVVLREEIRERLWPTGTQVEFDHGINAAIQKLRAALGDSAEHPRYIETVARRGYRFIGEVEQSSPAPTPVPIPKSRRRDYSWLGAGIVAASLILAAAARLREPPADPTVIRFNINAPDGNGFGGVPGPAISPDGRRIVFGTVAKNSYRLWLRSLDSPDAVPLPGADGGAEPFWSPDSASIAFFAADRKLKRTDVSGRSVPGPPVTLCDAADYAGGAWSSAHTILFSTDSGTLYSIPDTGGVPKPATRLDTTRHELSHIFPWFLPDGRHFLFGAMAAPYPSGHVTIRAGSLDSTDSQVVAEGESSAIFSQSRLLYVRNQTLMAQPFDARRLATTGDPVPVTSPIAVAGGSANLSASERGTLVYFKGAESPFELVWFDRSGNRLSTLAAVTPSSTAYPPVLSPDGKWIALDEIETGNADIWLYDAAHGLRSRFTFDPARKIAPVWSPDGGAIAFSSSRKGSFDLYRQSSGARQGAELLFADADDKYPTSWSPRGDFLLFDRRSDKPPYTSIWALPLGGGESHPFPVLQTAVAERRGQFSPDGRWIAYESQQSGKFEIYIAPFSGRAGTAGAARQISTVGGLFPRWRRDGRELFYYSYERRRLTAVAVNDGAIDTGNERELVACEYSSIIGYDVAPDGQRFLLKLRSRQFVSQPITVVQNWTAAVNLK